MERFVLTDTQWAKMVPHCLGKLGDPGRSGSDSRGFVKAVLWIVRTGSPWCDVPAAIGKWNTVFKRFRDWEGGRLPAPVFSDEPDMVDATIVKVHRHGQGAKGGLHAKPSADPKAA